MWKIYGSHNGLKLSVNNGPMDQQWTGLLYRTIAKARMRSRYDGTAAINLKGVRLGEKNLNPSFSIWLVSSYESGCKPNKTFKCACIFRPLSSNFKAIRLVSSEMNQPIRSQGGAQVLLAASSHHLVFYVDLI